MMIDEIEHRVPHLTTANNRPLYALERLLLEQQTGIETWFRNQWIKTPPPITSSVDLRNAGFKIAPVDTNLFPGGFNNLNRDFLPLCIQAMQSVIASTIPECAKILLIPENHTRNLFYFKSLSVLQEILTQAGFEVRIGSLIESLKEPEDIEVDPTQSLRLYPIERVGNTLKSGDFIPHLILLNNDLSSGIPEILQDLTQPIHPTPHLGWSSRLKSEHFAHYAEVSGNFAKTFKIDPWLIAPLFKACSAIDFMQNTGIECLASHISHLLNDITEKYKTYGITQEPFVVVKADRGTYGMGIMMVRDPAEITRLNRKERTRMSATKGGQKVTHVILQEGVYTFETWGEHAVAEPVVYMIGPYVIGGFYRVHKNKGDDENLNAPGMHFEPLAFVGSCNTPCLQTPERCTNRFYTYGVLARLAGLAAASEFSHLEANT